MIRLGSGIEISISKRPTPLSAEKKGTSSKAARSASLELGDALRKGSLRGCQGVGEGKPEMWRIG